MRVWPPDRKLRIGAGIIGTVVLGALLLRRDEKPQKRRAPNAPENVAERELRRWTGVTEHDPTALPILMEYWAATGQPYPGSPDIPWSGAFVITPKTHHNLVAGPQTVKLFTIYTPPNHIPGRVHRTRHEAENDIADQEFFGG